MTALGNVTTTAAALRRHIATAAERARREARTIVASYTLRLPAPVDPVAFFARGAARQDYRVYWERPAEGLALVGLGTARLIRQDGPDRFQRAASLARADLTSAVLGGDERAGGPVYLGGFAFASGERSPAWRDYPAGLLVLPRLLLTIRRDGTTLTLSAALGPETDEDAVAAALLDDLARLKEPAPLAQPGTPRILASEEHPSPEAWQAAVAEAAGAVRAGRFDKVVLARELRLRAERAFSPEASLRALRAAYPMAYVFAVGTPGACFLGATPELLARLTGREVETTCLAGSIARGATTEEDERLAGTLLASAKDRVEHAVVARAIQEALAAVCDDVFAEPAPRLLRMRNVQHLYTPVRGRLAAGYGILDLVARLHPTPAVGGVPRDAALAAIRAWEGFDRGWYAGPVGWLDRAGDGEFAVALRSALLAGVEARLFAGCGIVADSDPVAEYAETKLKFQPMLAALGSTP